MTLPDGSDVHALLRAAALTLRGDSARLDAEMLLAHAMGIGRMELLLHRGPVPADVLERFEAYAERRRQNEPTAYIIGEREFWSLPFLVTPATLIPRPDSETLVEAALEAAPHAQRVLDLGTGSGALLLSVLHELPGATGVGVDMSAQALAVAAENARRLGLGERANFVLSNWGAAISGEFDLVLANPPYVEDGAVLDRDVHAYEPHSALFAGADGLADYRRILPDLPRLLAPGGVAIMEFGAGQETALAALAQAMELSHGFRMDLSGRPRAILLRLNLARGVGNPAPPL